MKSRRPPDGLRELLAERLRELLDRTGRIEAHEREQDREVPSDWPDRAQYREDDEVVARLDDLTRAEVSRIRGALARLDAGTFGACTRCGTEIPPARIEAVPTTETCVACARALEAEPVRGSSGPRE